VSPTYLRPCIDASQDGRLSLSLGLQFDQPEQAVGLLPFGVGFGLPLAARLPTLLGRVLAVHLEHGLDGAQEGLGLGRRHLIVGVLGDLVFEDSRQELDRLGIVHVDADQ